MISLEMLKTFGAAIVFPVGRSVVGWAENALKDDKITPFELKQLAGTVVRVGIMSIAVYLGADAWGIDAGVLGSGASAFIIDKIFGAMKK